jgi:hypothetical protein
MIGGSTIARTQPPQIRRFTVAGSGIGITGEDAARVEFHSWMSRKLPSLLSCSEEQVHSKEHLLGAPASDSPLFSSSEEEEASGSPVSINGHLRRGGCRR